MGNNFCRRCGAPLPDDAKFCTKCGAPVKAQAYNTRQNQIKKSDNTVIYIIVAVAVAVILAAVVITAYLFYSQKKKDKEIESLKNEIVEKERLSDKASENKLGSTYEQTDNYTVDPDGLDITASSRKLTEDDLAGKTKKELELLRNSIYARYGYKFKRDDLAEYFSQFQWYTPITSDMSEVYTMMNDVERYNIQFIKKHE